ncbi:O-antigen ligase domain-containing protein [Butyrivibrio sp. X503]|uniref:O-antigen ligase family protein n=1 Tax=Butyrivibrio sp. X503 TaxID=2364878 RepID=UPI000EA85158|nr:O-antigen ligase family protein [Butyrivibrio sp. X503]RKM54956.1 O-antigen ligase domain-containing protein [Butyrivibrio sp. X503]
MEKTKKLTLLYLLLLTTVLPLYMKDGFYKLGEAKGVLFMALGGVFFVVSAVLMLISKTPFKLGLMGVLLFSNIITFLLSIDKKTALLGLDGWRMGLLSLLFSIFSACIISNGIEFKKIFVIAILIVPFAVCILGILGRFGIYPLGVSADDGSFLSTIGNINWFTAFLSVFVPLGGSIAATRKRFSLEFFLSEIIVIVGLLSLLLQGSESGLLIIAGTYLLLLFLGLSDRETFKAFLIQLFTLGIAMAIVYLLMFFFGKRYTYDDNLLILICQNHSGIILMAAVFFIYRLSRFAEEVNLEWKEKLYKKIFYVMILIGVAVVSVLLYKTYSDDFGNGRGIIWRMSFDMYKSLSPIRKIVGVGQDCFYKYAYSDPSWSESFINVFGGNRLTNAHNMYLTLLIEGGVMGLISFIFTFGYVLKNLIMIKDTDKKKHAGLCCALPIFVYLINGLVSFSTVVSTPYVFMILGYGLYVIKDDSEEITQDRERE